MPATYTIKVYPSNLDAITVTLDNETTLKYSNFSKNYYDDYLYYWGVGEVEVISATTSNSYPAPRITREVDTAYEPVTIIDFRPQNLYAIGDADNDPNGYIYVDNLTNPTGIYNNKGWASNNAFDWVWKIYSNFRTVNYDPSTNIYTIGCTAKDETSRPDVGR